MHLISGQFNEVLLWRRRVGEKGKGRKVREGESGVEGR